MIAADSLRIIVLSGVSIWWHSACRRACSASASALHFALRSHVQASCLERARPAAVVAVAGALVAGAAAPPGRRSPERERGVKAEGKTKGRGTGPRRKPVCTWVWRSTARHRRRAAWGVRPALMQAYPRASHDKTRCGFTGERP